MRAGWLVFVIACGAPTPVERVDKMDDVDALIRIVKDDDKSVAALHAWMRLGELPKERTRQKVFRLFNTRKWKVRWLAGSLVLWGGTTKDIAEFMQHLPTNGDHAIGLAEFTTYGALIARMDAPTGEPAARDRLLTYLRSPALGPKLTALGYFYEGKKADVSLVQPSESDTTPLPRCTVSDECGWSCEEKAITTVGEFVKFCIEPTMTND